MNCAELYERENEMLIDRLYSTQEQHILCDICHEHLHESAPEWRLALELCPDSWVCSDDCAKLWLEKNWETVEELEDE